MHICITSSGESPLTTIDSHAGRPEEVVESLPKTFYYFQFVSLSFAWMPAKLVKKKKSQRKVQEDNRQMKQQFKIYNISKFDNVSKPLVVQSKVKTQYILDYIFRPTSFWTQDIGVDLQILDIIRDRLFFTGFAHPHGAGSKHDLFNETFWAFILETFMVFLRFSISMDAMKEVSINTVERRLWRR